MKYNDVFKKIPGSFRDPAGFLFARNGDIFRQVNNCYSETYKTLINSGLYENLIKSGFLIPHEELGFECINPSICHKVLKPEKIPFISYPYEWCFSQLKDAALLILEIQKIALRHGMSLKDASAYNIQFRKNRPILIDTLSFENYREGSPWVAYGQFCRHFLAPLALMSYKDIRHNRISQIYIDGVPLDLASGMLPMATRLKPAILVHIHIHAKYQARFADKEVDIKRHVIGKNAIYGLIDSLRSAIKSLKWPCPDGGWGGYYNDTVYSHDALHDKELIVSALLDKVRAKTAWDLGANTGRFSRIASSKGIETISLDSDAACVEKNYLGCTENGLSNILPLVMDLENPSPALGWASSERASLLDRGPADAALALALVHHLAITNNLPLERIAEFFQRICLSAIIEFVPKNDPQVKKLLAVREDIFSDYSQKCFEEVFNRYFAISEAVPIKGTERVVYLMANRQEVHA